MIPRARCVVVSLLAVAPCLGCASVHPPFTRASTGAVPSEPHRATLVFLWPSTSCDPGGYYTLVSSDGRFVGNVAAGTQLRVEVPPGPLTVVGWNQPTEEAAGAGSPATVPVLRARLAEGRTYYVRMLFGEWDETGPHDTTWAWPRAMWRGGARRRCVMRSPREDTSSAMVTVTPASHSWKDVPGWTARLETLAPDRARGQAWLDEHGSSLRTHVAEGEARYAGLRAEARRMATVEPRDGVATTR